MNKNVKKNNRDNSQQAARNAMLKEKRIEVDAKITSFVSVC